MGSSRNARTDTALRDIAALVERGILVRNPEGGAAQATRLRSLAFTCSFSIEHLDVNSDQFFRTSDAVLSHFQVGTG